MLKHSISFQNAFAGIWSAITTQLNLRIHFLLGSLTLALAVFLRVSYSELLVIVLTIMIVMFSEMVNTAIESVCDAITLEQNAYIKTAKDVSAGGVLLSAIFAIIIACMIFVPKLMVL